MKGEGLHVLNERMKTIDPDANEIYKFIGVEQPMELRMNIITRTELNDKNLVKAINTKFIPVAAYTMNVCKFT